MKSKEKNIKFSLEKIKVITNIVIIILLIILILQRSGIFNNTFTIGKIGKNKLNNGELIITEDGQVAQTVNASNWDTSKVNIVADADGKNVPVPKGYVGSSVAGENKVNDGYVIYEGDSAVTSSNVSVARTSRNQWVWIPVEHPDRIYEEVDGVKKSKLYLYGISGRAEYKNENYEPAIVPESDTQTNLTNGGLSGMTPDKLHQELQQEFDSTIESIKRYGGFYIGRYETGNLSQSKPAVIKLNRDINNQTWYTMYSKMKYLSANENVKTNMIWGCLWDEVIIWFIERRSLSYPEAVDNSSIWGNYLDSTFSYTRPSGNSDTKPANSGVLIPTGGSNYTKKQNIFDLSGNVWELTLEGDGISGRTRRGGNSQNLSSNRPVSTRGSNTLPTDLRENLGTRAYLYIK